VKINQLLANQVGEIAKQAGQIVMGYWGKPLILNDKPGAGFATQADTEAESFIIEQLKKIDPTIPFWAEESGKSSDNSDWYWVIDPLDGTTNFAHTIPYFSISIALTHKNEPQVGAIYAPILDELFIAYKGGGATMNGQAIQVSKSSFERCIIVGNLSYTNVNDYVDCFHNMQIVRSKIDAIRIMGSAALGLAYVAAGRFDGSFFHRLSWWDIAAGVIILQEAGAQVSDFNGNKIDPNYQSFLSAGPEVYDRLIALLG